MTKFFFLFLLIFIIGCKDNSNKNNVVQVKDSIMNKYFRVIDSLPFADTLDPKFALLKAYHKNDTNYLKASYAETSKLLQDRKQITGYYTCEEPPPINKLNFKEAYRFMYGASFCDTAVNITIGKKRDSIVLDVYIYKTRDGQPNCKTIGHTVKLLNSKDWDKLIEGINYSDFWGLKEDNGRHGLDGSSLRVTGYESPVNAFQGRYKTIYRWSAEDMAIGNLFKKIIDLADIKVQCFHYQLK